MTVNSRQERLKKTIAFLKFKNLVKSQKDLAIKIDINPNSLSKAVSGNSNYLTDSLFKKLALTFDILNLYWLLDGTGVIEKDSSTQNVVSEHKPVYNSKKDLLDDLTPDEILDYIIIYKEKFRPEPKIDAVVALFANFEQQRVLKEVYEKADKLQELMEKLQNK